MKRITVKSKKNSIFLIDEENQSIGKILFNIISGYKEKIVIADDIYSIRNTGFLWNDNKVYNKENNLLLKTEIAKNRIIYFGKFTQIFYNVPFNSDHGLSLKNYYF